MVAVYHTQNNSEVAIHWGVIGEPNRNIKIVLNILFFQKIIIMSNIFYN